MKPIPPAYDNKGTKPPPAASGPGSMNEEEDEDAE